MRLTQEQKCRIFSYLTNTKNIIEIFSVFEFGDKKHGDKKWTTEEHITHALSHAKDTGIDEETGQPKQAHTIARLILAIETELEKV